MIPLVYVHVATIAIGSLCLPLAVVIGRDLRRNAAILKQIETLLEEKP